MQFCRYAHFAKTQNGGRCDNSSPFSYPHNNLHGGQAIILTTYGNHVSAASKDNVGADIPQLQLKQIVAIGNDLFLQLLS